jgi:hypothetical protein
MWFTALIPLLSGIFGENGPLGQFFKTKAAQVQAKQDYELALLKANAEAAVQASIADTAQRANYLAATSNGFRQGTFYWMSAIILYSILFPSKAEALWHNFNLIPQWVQYVYVAMLSVTWGLPVAKENVGLMFSSIGRAIEARRDYKLEKARINREAVFASLRAKLFPKGMSQAQVDIVDGALDDGEK